MSHPFLNKSSTVAFSQSSLHYITLGCFLMGFFSSIHQIPKWNVSVREIIKDICMFNEQKFRRARRAECYGAQGLVNTCGLE